MLLVACECNTAGTKLNTECDIESGQCTCINEAITGRACDSCLADAQG